MHLRRVVKEKPSNKEPLVVGPLSPRAGSKSSLGCLTFILSAQFPKIYLKAAAGQGLLPWVYLTIYWRTFLEERGQATRFYL